MESEVRSLSSGGLISERQRNDPGAADESEINDLLRLARSLTPRPVEFRNALNDLIAGRIQVMLITGTLAQHVRDGRARGLATLLPARSKALPDLPTMVESGLPPFPGIPWMGLFGPAKLPKELVDRLSKELLATLAKPEVRVQIERQAMELNPLSAEGMGALAKDQVAVWRKLTTDAGMVAE